MPRTASTDPVPEVGEPDLAVQDQWPGSGDEKEWSTGHLAHHLSSLTRLHLNVPHGWCTSRHTLIQADEGKLFLLLDVNRRAWTNVINLLTQTTCSLKQTACATVEVTYGQVVPPAVGIQSIRLPPRSPNMNAYAERFVRLIKHECLTKVIRIGERHLSLVIDEFTEHYHLERNHQGIDNQLIDGEPSNTPASRVECSE